MPQQLTTQDAAELLGDVRLVWSRVCPTVPEPWEEDELIDTAFRSLCTFLERGIKTSQSPQHLVWAVVQTTHQLLTVSNAQLIDDHRNQIEMLNDIGRSMLLRTQGVAPDIQ